MRFLALLLLAAILLSGCASPSGDSDDPAPATAPAGGSSSSSSLSPSPQSTSVQQVTLLEQPFSMDPMIQFVELPVTVPQGTLNVNGTLTVAQGVYRTLILYGLDSCIAELYQISVVVVAEQVAEFSCQPRSGDYLLRLKSEDAVVNGRLVITATVAVD